ncbi:hypothetical protein [Hydrocarboniphaga sp.]|uniref:hypothetical protein n=1 Tax=Hydrocarboniphaga sp. TaxID=2033016 RepID=UPI003D0C3D2D
MSIADKVRAWHVPLSEREATLGAAHDRLSEFGLNQDDIPFLIQLVENPKYDFPGIDLFSGATDLRAHDQIHILLGRGLLPKDEAFVLGFTMGSTEQVGQMEERLFSFFTQYLYPRAYRFSDEDIRVFRDAVRLGFISDVQRLDKVDYEALRGLSLAEARRKIGLEDDLLRAYYAIEKNRYPHSFESQRLLD